jgi:hypothetical protein
VIASVLREADTRVITNLVAGAEVLQVGCWQGHDTAALAKVAACVVTIGAHPMLEHAGFADQVSMWVTIQRFYRVADRTLLVQGEVPALLGMFAPGQFDVAVLDLNALGHLVFPNLLIPLKIVAGRLIVISDRYQDWAMWTSAMAELGYSAEQCGKVWVFDPAPAGTETETEKGS